MKKLIIISYIMLSGFILVAQSDSARVIDLLQTGGVIANTIRPQDWINGVDNTVVSGIITAVASLVLGLIARLKEKKKLRKNGKLND